MAAAAEWFVRTLRGPEPRPATLVLSGSTGCGKTHTARKIHTFARDYGPDIILSKKLAHWSALWLDWTAIAESDDEDDFRDVLYQISQSTFIALDDVGSESDRFKNGIPASRLRRVLSEMKRQWIVVTCNLSQSEMIAQYDVRIADRLEKFQWVELGEVPSYRPKLK